MSTRPRPICPGCWRKRRPGEEIIIAKAGKPKVRLVPIEDPPKRQLGFMEGITLPDSFFFDPLPAEELALWEGED